MKYLVFFLVLNISNKLNLFTFFLSFKLQESDFEVGGIGCALRFLKKDLHGPVPTEFLELMKIILQFIYI